MSDANTLVRSQPVSFEEAEDDTPWLPLFPEGRMRGDNLLKLFIDMKLENRFLTMLSEGEHKSEEFKTDVPVDVPEINVKTLPVKSSSSSMGTWATRAEVNEGLKEEPSQTGAQRERSPILDSPAAECLR